MSERGRKILQRIRRIALSLPEVSERPSDQAPCFYVRSKKPFCRFHDHHRGDDRISMWCSVPHVLQDALLASDDEKFFRPTPSRSGVFADWVGVYLDRGKVDWNEVESILEEAFCKVAPESLSKHR